MSDKKNNNTINLDDDLALSSIEEKYFPIFKPAEVIAQKQEFARQWIALLIVGSLVGIVLFSFMSFWFRSSNTTADEIVKLVEALISPVIGIVGAVTGFYFGERRTRDESGSKENSGNSGGS